ncbi:MAG TPA: hypothetical protein VFY89_01740, partial [Ktedonobacterales bacterium]
HGMKRIPEHDVQVYLEAVNFRHLVRGRFVRDSRDGEIRYEMPVPADGGTLTDAQLVRAIQHAVSTWETYAPTILLLLLRKITLREALAALENAA